MNDPIADLLTRIRNAQMRKSKVFVMPSSKMVVSIVDILKKEGFIEDYKNNESGVIAGKEIIINLKYNDGKPSITGLKRISKPGVRRYVGYRDIRKVLGGLGVSIVSTPRGVMTGDSARKERVGGEILCEIW
ncbi:30S ribosomal protein S8 [Candidatus Dojkabacteria bacterium]|nr:30S ribosomal protein S8 [Candidatus Dojkabacteria bacterium]